MRREYDLEDILAEFSEHSLDAEAAKLQAAEEAAAEAAAAEAASAETVLSPDDSLSEELVAELPEEEPVPEAPEEEEVLSEDEQQLTRVFKAPKPAAAVKPEEEPEEKPRKKKKAKKESFLARLGLGTLSLIFAVISLGVLAWSLQNLHPDTGAPVKTNRPAASSSTNLVTRLDAGLNNARANALSDIAYIPKHYSIPEGETVAPRPNEACFGSVSPSEASKVMDVIQQARDSGLLEGQEVIFSPDLNFRSDTDIQYYYDETILTILWKELIDGFTVTCCETKIADASQFRRKFVDDTFGSSNKLFATSIAASVNSVVAMNADFYAFRDFGIVVFDRDLCRFGQDTYTGQYKKYNCTDTLFINEEGDFLFWHRLQEASPEEMKTFIADNNILFSIAFGPILVENGELQVCDWYPAGEIDKGYSRAGIGLKDHLHYFYMSLNHSTEQAARWTVNQFGEQMYRRGLQQAYCLDGGQTSEIVWRGSPFNYIDFGGEREVSDIIYFATAIPESEGTP